MRRTVFGSTTKFWPSARLGWIPCRSSSSAARRPVIVTGGVWPLLPADADLDDAGARIGELRDRAPVEVDDATAAVRSPVGHHAGRGGAGVEAGDGDRGALGQ